jgi:hypothetical protein
VRFHVKKAFAIGILAIGALALAYGAFGSMQRTQEEVNVGPLEITVALAIVGGGFLTRRST